MFKYLLRVTKEVDVDSEEAKKFENKDENKAAEQPESNKSAQVGIKRSSNIGNILGKVMGKKPKMTTLDKSRLDWENFKKDENIDDEIKLHNKGKDGYLERQAFLQRVDLRQFEVEKSIREINRSKR
ncbi:craniofacial development protein 1-like [Centruroides sculpturatus]|uniref:craniofacial development protein 1-like n=1 Tax=Centruroides sculpturatus TaxID=218467 RepID=UPI000C6E3C0D|nr:craniofacial development protein 1-like [Centruroides sculpturatus]